MAKAIIRMMSPRCLSAAVSCHVTTEHFHQLDLWLKAKSGII